MRSERIHLQFSAHGDPLHSFFIAGGTVSRQALLARRFVPFQTHLTDRNLVPCPPHGALHYKIMQSN